MSADEITQRIARTQEFLKQADTNHNGMIDPDEASDPQAKNMLDRIFGRMGKEPHYPMAISEILQGYEAHLRARGSTSDGGSSSAASSPQAGPSPATGLTLPAGIGTGSYLASGGGSSSSPTSSPVILSVSGTAGANLTVPPPTSVVVPSASAPPSAASSPADAKPAPRRPGRFLTPRERLPQGLPDWFLEKDVHGNGQITMAEFTDNWTPEKVAEFARYDLNHDGIITAAECLKVEKAKAASK